jgi:hypothetical protein
MQPVLQSTARDSATRLPKCACNSEPPPAREITLQGRAGLSLRRLLSNCLFLFGRRYAARPGLGPGLWQESEARLAPPVINTYIQQSIGTSAWAGKFHDRNDPVGLPGLQGHRPTRGMVRGGIDA